jgi:hypothetical protein
MIIFNLLRLLVYEKVNKKRKQNGIFYNIIEYVILYNS